MTTDTLEREHEEYRPSYRAAGGVTAFIFLIYLLTLAPSTAMWDTSEYIAAAYTFGLPHPPGNPFFVLLGRFFAILPIAPNVAMRINILAALCSAAAAGFWFLITERVLVGWLAERWQRIVGSTGGTDRRERLHRLVAIGCQRKGLHHLAVGIGAGVVVDRALVRRSARRESG